LIEVIGNPGFARNMSERGWQVREKAGGVPAARSWSPDENPRRNIQKGRGEPARRSSRHQRPTVCAKFSQ
jgi:hypothetical protein